MTERKAFPLSWPEGWNRTTSRTSGQFKHFDSRINVAQAVGRLLGELRRMGIPDYNVIISTNVPLRLDGFPRSDQEPADPGAAAYWKKNDKQAMRCMAIDRYTRVADNLAAIAATLDAMRAIERHGGGQILERAFLGFAALPEKASQPWREVLGIPLEEFVTLQVIEDKFRQLVKLYYPDVPGTGNREKFEQIQQARVAARMEIYA